MAPQDVTCVFVPGAWHSPNGYDAVISQLHQIGYNTSKVWTPSVVRPGQKPIPDIEPDVAEVRKHLSEAIDKGQKVVLVLHSYAGMLGSMAAEGFDQPSLAAKGHTDGRGIVHVVYFCAFMLLKGESLMTLQAGPSDWVDVNMEDLTARPINPARVFYNDFESQEEIDKWVADLNPWSLGVSSATQSHEPWKLVPATYLACTNDNAIPVAWQRSFCQKAKDAGALDLRVIEWDCSHTPFGSRPVESSQVIRSAIETDVVPPSSLTVKGGVTETVEAVKVQA